MKVGGTQLNVQIKTISFWEETMKLPKWKCNQKRNVYQHVASHDQGQKFASFLAKYESSMPHSAYWHFPQEAFQKTLCLRLVGHWRWRGDYMWASSELSSCHSHTGILCHLGCPRGSYLASSSHSGKMYVCQKWRVISVSCKQMSFVAWDLSDGWNPTFRQVNWVPGFQLAASFSRVHYVQIPHSLYGSDDTQIP